MYYGEESPCTKLNLSKLLNYDGNESSSPMSDVQRKYSI